MVRFQIPDDAVCGRSKTPGLKATGLHFAPGQIVTTSDEHLIKQLKIAGATVLEGNANVSAPSVRQFRAQGHSEEDATALVAYERAIIDGADTETARQKSLEARHAYRKGVVEVRRHKAHVAALVLKPIAELLKEGFTPEDAAAEHVFVKALKAGANEAEAREQAFAARDKVLAEFKEKAEKQRPRPVPTIGELMASGYSERAAHGVVARLKSLAANGSESEAVEAEGRALSAFDEQQRAALVAEDAQPDEEVTDGNASPAVGGQGKAGHPAVRDGGRQRRSSRTRRG